MNREDRKALAAQMYDALYAHFTFHLHMDESEAESNTLILMSKMQTMMEEQKSFSALAAESTAEENNLDSPHFYGDVEQIDQRPLTKSAFIVFEFMVRHEGQYFTHQEVSDATGVHMVTVGDRIRDFRMKQWGEHHTPKRRRAGTRTWEYTMFPNKESQSYAHFLSQHTHAN